MNRTDNINTLISGFKQSITIYDYRNLFNMLVESIGETNISARVVHVLYLKLFFSTKYSLDNIPNDFVRINSTIQIIDQDGIRQLIRIVLPENRKSDSYISIYSPLGLACLGCKENTVTQYVDYEEKKRIKIEKIISHCNIPKL